MGETVPERGQPAVPAARILSHLYEVGQLIQTIREPKELLERILDLALQILGAERGMILLRPDPIPEDGDSSLVLAAIRKLEEKTVAEARAHSHTAVREALQGRPVVALDVGADPRLAQIESISLYDIQSLICVPIGRRAADSNGEARYVPEEIRGVLYIDSRRRGVPFRDEDLRFLTAFAAQAAMALESAKLYRRLRRENHRLAGQARARSRYEDLLGRSDAMQEVYALLDRAAESHFPAILLGETGTGKELAARALHVRGSRRNQPFLAVNCAAFSEGLLESELFGHVRGAFTGADTDRRGLFELADKGDLLLDEIGGMSPGMQAKLLRVLQEGEFRPLGSKRLRQTDVRILAATNQDLDGLVKEGRFREDLFYRLNVIRILMPPLRQRREDIPQLIEEFVGRSVGDGGLKRPEFNAAALREMTAHPWPGNVRELEHTVQKAVLYARGGKVDAPLVRKLLPRAAPITDAAISGFPSWRELEARHVLRALEICNWNREEAARRLGIGRATIYRKMKEYEIAPSAAPARRPRAGGLTKG